MYNKYFEAEGGTFSGLYRPIEDERKITGDAPCAKRENCERRGFDIKRLISKLDVDKMGLLPLVLLLLLMLDVDDEEKLIIIALAVIFGI